MIKNYLTIAFRNLLRYKGYSAINLLGLTIGITAFILIGVYLQHELSYDRFHAKADRIYRINNEITGKGDQYIYPTCTAALPVAMQNDLPGVAKFVRFFKMPETIVKVGDELFKEKKAYAADSTLFSVFSFKLLEGDAAKALAEPFSVVLTQSAAQKYFKGVPALGQSINLPGFLNQAVKITGIMEDVPATSHMQFTFILSLVTANEAFAPDFISSWQNDGFYSYIVLEEGYGVETIQSQLPALIKKYINTEQQTNINPFLVALTDIHLHSSLRNEMEPNGSITYVYIFSAVALFMIIIAGINYMNLATARSARRAREVGMRKVLGAERRQLISQFLAESVLLTLLATLMALVVASVLMPAFNRLTGQSLQLNITENPVLVAVLVVVVIVLGLVTGSYPAFYLSSFLPGEVLKGKTTKGGSGASSLRKALVLFQFVISIILIISTWLVFKQLDYLQNKNLGFNKEHMLVIPNTNNAITPNLNSFKAELLKNPGIEQVSATLSIPGGLRPIIGVQSETLPDERNLTLAGINADFEYLKTMGIRLVKGRDFDPALKTDSTDAVIINEQAVKLLRLGDNPIGKTIQLAAGPEPSKRRVIGVVNDINFEPLYRQTEAAFWAPMFPFYTFLLVKINPENSQHSIAHVAQQWKNFAPNQPFEYTFLDEDLNQLYRAEQQMSKIVTYFSVLAIFIACLGLLGLTSFSIEQRRKEIGIRKVLGASVASIVAMLINEYTKLILVASLIAFPLAWYLGNKWLDKFVFHISMGWWWFIAAAILAFFIAAVTVGYQAVKAALSNPVASLRAE